VADRRRGGGVTGTETLAPPLAAIAEQAAAAAQARGEPDWAGERRRVGFEYFSATGLPSTRDEEWRFTPLQGLGSISFGLPAPGSATLDGIAPLLLGGDGPRAVLVDGRFAPELSRLAGLPAGITVGSLAEALNGEHPVAREHLTRHVQPEFTPFTALNTALWQDGVFVHAAAGASPGRPLEVLHLSTAAANQAVVAPRLLVVAEREASLRVSETFAGIGASGSLTTAVAEFVLRENARVEHVRVQREALDSWHAGFTMVDQARDSHYRSFTLSLGARWSRHNLHARHGGSNVETLLYGLYLARDEQLTDNHTVIFHDQPDCNSWEVYKGVLGDRARGVFNGKVIVQPIAQHTDAKQTNRNLLLSDDARVDTKPQLEIFADDVKCTHGATVGRLDEQQRFYLRTRGIAGRTAQALLIWAFAAEVLLEVTDAATRVSLESLVRQRLDQMIP